MRTFDLDKISIRETFERKYPLFDDCWISSGVFETYDFIDLSLTSLSCDYTSEKFWDKFIVNFF